MSINNDIIFIYQNLEIVMSRCVIVGGAEIKDYNYIKSCVQSDDFFIFCDCGLRHMERLCVQPDLIVGDFDSSENPQLSVETIVLPCEKDDTDTYFAIKEAIKRGYEDFLLIGVIGQRLDHTLGNVSILLYLEASGMNGVIIDDYSQMMIVSDKPIYIEDSYSFFSLLNITGKANGVYIENAKYPLFDAQINCEYQYGISNEVIKNKTAKVWVNDGKLLLIKVR